MHFLTVLEARSPKSRLYGKTLSWLSLVSGSCPNSGRPLAYNYIPLISASSITLLLCVLLCLLEGCLTFIGFRAQLDPEWSHLNPYPFRGLGGHKIWGEYNSTQHRAWGSFYVPNSGVTCVDSGTNLKELIYLSQFFHFLKSYGWNFPMSNA